MLNSVKFMIDWEQGVGFSITAKDMSDLEAETITIVYAQEGGPNGDVGEFWKQYTAVVNEYFKRFMKHIGEDLIGNG